MTLPHNILASTQGANLISNVPHNLSDAARTIALLVKHAQALGKREIEVTQEAEEAWVVLMLTSVGRMTSSPEWRLSGSFAGVVFR